MKRQGVIQYIYTIFNLQIDMYTQEIAELVEISSLQAASLLRICKTLLNSHSCASTTYKSSAQNALVAISYIIHQ